MTWMWVHTSMRTKKKRKEKKRKDTNKESVCNKRAETWIFFKALCGLWELLLPELYRFHDLQSNHSEV